MLAFSDLPKELIHYIAETIHGDVYRAGKGEWRNANDFQNWPSRSVPRDARTLSRVNKACYESLLPLLFRSVMLSKRATPGFLRALRESPHDPGRYVRSIMLLELETFGERSNKEADQVDRDYLQALWQESSEQMRAAAERTDQTSWNVARWRILEMTPGLERLFIYRRGMLPLYQAHPGSLPFPWTSLEQLSIYDEGIDAIEDGVEPAHYLSAFIRDDMTVRGLLIGSSIAISTEDTAAAEAVQLATQNLQFLSISLGTDLRNQQLSIFTQSRHLTYITLQIGDIQPNQLKLFDFFSDNLALQRSLRGLRIDAWTLHDDLANLGSLLGCFEHYDLLRELRLPAQCLLEGSDGTSIRLAVSKVPRTVHRLHIDFKWGCHLVDEEQDEAMQHAFFRLAALRIRALSTVVQILAESRSKGKAIAPLLKRIQVDELLEESIIKALINATAFHHIREQIFGDLRLLRDAAQAACLTVEHASLDEDTFQPLEDDSLLLHALYPDDTAEGVTSEL